MNLFQPILNQMIFLFSFIILGFILSKWKFIPDNSATVLSKLENIIFVPGLVLATFIDKCTLEVLATAWKLLVAGFVLVLVLIPISIFAAKLCFKEKFLQNIATYGLAFANFGFMGNAIMNGIFPEIFFEYTIFTLPLWFMIYLWGAPVLLIAGSSDGEKKPFKERLKAFLNPMLVSMFIGIVIGLTKLPIPTALMSAVRVAGDCMSPVAMLLTGITIGKTDILKLLKKWRLYLATFIKLVVYPLLYIGIFALLPKGWISSTILICAMNVMCMPMGLNSIVIPAAYGKDTSDAAGLALVSHTLSVITIPLMFMIFQNLILG